MTAETITPARSKFPRIFSIRLSVQARSTSMSDSPRESLVEHFDSKKHDHRAEYQAQPFRFCLDQNATAYKGAAEDSKHHRHGESRINVAAVQVHARAGGRGNANHEVAGSGGDLEGNLHGLVHGQNLHGAGADAEQAGQCAGAKHDAEARGQPLNVVVPHAFEIREAAVEA